MNRLVTVSNRQLYLEQHGEAGPVVIIEVGLGYKPGTQHQGWFPIRDALADSVRVILYVRAGTASATPPTFTDYANDLHAMLHAAHLPPPYILIGGSIGGPIITLFGHLFPGEVRGLIMVDAAHPEQWARMAALLPQRLAAENPAVREFYEEDIAAVLDPERNEEGMDVLRSIPAFAGATLGDLPLIVLTAGKGEWDEGFPEAVAADIEREWLVMQHELAALSTRGVQRVVADSGHAMHNDRPDAILEAAGELLAELSGACPSNAPANRS